MAEGIHVWSLQVADHVGVIDICRDYLNEEERAKADRYAFDKDRHAFVLGRSLVRWLMATRLGIAPRQISFRFNGYGKPYVVGAEVQFNVSHSGGVVLVGVADQFEIGVDVEWKREVSDMQKLAERFFSPSEISALQTASYSDPSEGFFDCWTRKEAYIKARGMGLSIELDKFDVPLHAERQLSWQSIRSHDAESWYVRSLSVAPSHAAAVAAPIPDVTVTQWMCSPADPFQATRVAP